LSVVAGLLWVPAILGGVTVLPDFLQGALPAVAGNSGAGAEWVLELLAAAASLGGIYLAYWLYMQSPEAAAGLAARRGAAASQRLVRSGWGFDAVYQALLLLPFLWLAETSRRDVIDRIYEIVAQICRGLYFPLSALQNGRLRWYAAGIGTGAAILVTLTVFV